MIASESMKDYLTYLDGSDHLHVRLAISSDYQNLRPGQAIIQARSLKGAGFSEIFYWQRYYGREIPRDKTTGQPIIVEE